MILSTHKTSDLHLTQHEFRVPLNYSQPDTEISVFARELKALNETRALPYLVYLQGGPGSESPRPLEKSGWIKRALKDYRVLLLDQRGTGLSTPITFQTLEPLSATEQAEYLSHFRLDNIVRDAEFIRAELIGDKKWSLLGQSYGGFCSLRYLSAAPEALEKVFITGGIPSITRPVDEVYKATYKILTEKNELFFERYPEAQAWCQDIANYLLEHDTRLPNGQRFTVEQFQQLGMALGSSTGFESLYYLLEEAFVTIEGKKTLSYTFLLDAFTSMGFHRHPIFSILHEGIYCQNYASNWSAERIRQDNEAFNYQPNKAFLFTAEMIYPWMFEQYKNLIPMKEAAQILAEKTDWPSLYDLKVLNQNKVPVAAALYFHDVYVPLELSLETVKQVPNIKTWITNEYEHNGLRADGERVLDKLISLLAE